MATVTVKGLTGVHCDVTVTLGSTTMNGLTALVRAVEGGSIAANYYGEIALATDPSINQTNNGTDTLSAAGVADGDLLIASPRKDPTAVDKETRQVQKLTIAEAKRKGLAAADTNANYYRTANTLDTTLIPNPYEANAYNADDDENTGSLTDGRPFT